MANLALASSETFMAWSEMLIVTGSLLALLRRFRSRRGRQGRTCARCGSGAHCAHMKDITFTVTPCDETGGFVARWDDAPGRGGITTQGDSFAELDAMVADAVNGYFEPPTRPQKVRLHFVEDPVVPLR